MLIILKNLNKTIETFEESTIIERINELEFNDLKKLFNIYNQQNNTIIKLFKSQQNLNQASLIYFNNMLNSKKNRYHKQICWPDGKYIGNNYKGCFPSSNINYNRVMY
jgi:hypothetical protein